MLQGSLTIFATIFTPQGDGNSLCASYGVTCRDIRHDIYPARGRKLIIRAIAHVVSACRFATIFTPQGDGNYLTSIMNAYPDLNITFATIFTPQGDGNSALVPVPTMGLAAAFATIFTPQGDGNTERVQQNGV